MALPLFVLMVLTVVCNTVPLGNKKSDKIDQLSIADLIAKAIYSIYFKKSIPEIFELDEAATC